MTDLSETNAKSEKRESFVLPWNESCMSYARTAKGPINKCLLKTIETQFISLNEPALSFEHFSMGALFLNSKFPRISGCTGL